MNHEKTTCITGLGTVTGYGWGVSELWNGLRSGKPAAALHSDFGREQGQSGWVVRVPDGGEVTDGTRFARAMRSAVREAVADARTRGWRPDGRVGVIHACVLGDLEMYPMVVPGAGNYTGRQYVTVTPSTPLSLLMKEHDFHGPVLTVSAMCTSGVAAMVTAKTWLDCGLADDVVVVATDLSARPEVVRMFVELGVAITDRDPLDACRPFQAGTSGFTFGEAAVATVLTQRSDTDAYAQVLGGAMSHDGYHVTSVDPGLDHVRACVERALDQAGVSGDDVAYMNAHGPGTKQCDAAEGWIAQNMLPNAQVFSVKPLTGHCQAAAGAVELATSLLAYEHGEIPAPALVAEPALSQVLNGRTPSAGGITVKSSLGMGGHNAALVLCDA